jgi:hypothetical protein
MVITWSCACDEITVQDQSGCRQWLALYEREARILTGRLRFGLDGHAY